MMTEVGGKLKAGLLVASVALFGVLAFSARTADIVKIKGEACEKFVSGQSKSSIRVRVTDKASYKAVSQVENLADVRSRMLEHDFNVIVYNLVDNYVRDLMVRTTSQNDNELCVKVTGALLAADIDTVVANYSPNMPAPEYDIKEAAGLEEEVLTDEDEPQADTPSEPEADVLYSGPEELQQEQEQIAAEETDNDPLLTEEESRQRQDEVAELDEEDAPTSENALTDNEAQTVDPLTANEETSLGELPPPPLVTTTSAEVQPTAEAPSAEQAPAETQPTAPISTVEEDAYVYVGPVEFNNNTHSAKPAQVLKDMFADTKGYQLVDSPAAAGYVFLPKVLKAKVDALNSQTKRIQMVVSLQLRVQNSSISFSEHQNRFVLFESGEKEQEIARKLLHKLLRKAGRKLFEKVEQAEAKRKAQGLPQIITPSK